MNYWMLSSNENDFQLSELMKCEDSVDWVQNRNYERGDIVFMYRTHPESRVVYKMKVEQINLRRADYIAKKEYWKNGENNEKYQEGLKKNRFVRLKRIGIATESSNLKLKDLQNIKKNLSVRGSQRIQGELLDYILGEFDSFTDDDAACIVDSENKIYEGAKLQVTVNKYERNQDARNKCLREKGYSCVVCHINFEDIYGQLGHNFIHVHHIVPISEIGKEYVIDPIKDLVPVCPNCHAMLHKGKNGKVLTIEELTQIMETVKIQKQ